MTIQNASHRMICDFPCVWSNISNQHTRSSQFEDRKWPLFLSLKKKNTISTFDKTAYISNYKLLFPKQFKPKISFIVLLIVILVLKAKGYNTNFYHLIQHLQHNMLQMTFFHKEIKPQLRDRRYSQGKKHISKNPNSTQLHCSPWCPSVVTYGLHVFLPSTVEYITFANIVPHNSEQCSNFLSKNQ